MTNIFLKKLYEITETTIVNINESSKANFERSDRIITWIVGFSIGIFVLVFPKDLIVGLSKIDKFTLSILNFSLFVIIFGLLYRICSFLTQTLNSIILSDISNYFRGLNINTDEIPFPREISGDETTFQLIQYLKEDFNYSLSYLVYAEDSKLNKILINYYNILAEENNLEKQLTTFKKQIGKYFGIGVKYLDFFSIEKNIKIRGIIYISISIITSILFITTIGIFVLGAIEILIMINS